MNEFLTTTLSYPAVVLTVLLAACGVYWLMVIVGALGVDALDMDLDGVDGAAEGAAEGGAEGAASSAAEGATLLASLLSALKVRGVPTSLMVSVWLLLSWTGTNLLVRAVLPTLTFAPGWVGGTGLAVLAIVLSFPLASVLVRPLGRLLKVEAPTHRQALVGAVVRIDTSRVDDKFGSAHAENGGAGLIVPVRCGTDNKLTRGSRALVLSYDREREIYEVTPMDEILPSDAADR